MVLDGDIVIDGGEAIVFTNTYTAPPADEPPVEEPPVEEPPVDEPPVDTGDRGYAPTVAMVAVAGGLFAVTLLGGKRRRADEEM